MNMTSSWHFNGSLSYGAETVGIFTSGGSSSPCDGGGGGCDGFHEPYSVSNWYEDIPLRAFARASTVTLISTGSGGGGGGSGAIAVKT